MACQWAVHIHTLCYCFMRTFTITKTQTTPKIAKNVNSNLKLIFFLFQFILIRITMCTLCTSIQLIVFNFYCTWTCSTSPSRWLNAFIQSLCCEFHSFNIQLKWQHINLYHFILKFALISRTFFFCLPLINSLNGRFHRITFIPKQIT